MSFQTENCDDKRTLKALVSDVPLNDRRSLRTSRRHSLLSSSAARSERMAENRSLLNQRVDNVQTPKGRACGANFRSFQSARDLASPESADRAASLKAGLKSLMRVKSGDQRPFGPKLSFAAPNYSILEIPEDEEGEEELFVPPGNYKVSPTCANHPLKKAKYSAVIAKSVTAFGELCCFCSRCAVELVKNDIRVTRLPLESLLNDSCSSPLQSAIASLSRTVFERRQAALQETEQLANVLAAVDSEHSLQSMNLEELQEQLFEAVRSAFQSAKQELEASSERNRSIVLGLTKKVAFCSSELLKLEQRLSCEGVTQETLISAKRDFDRLNRFFETEKARIGAVKLKRFNVNLASSFSEEIERFVTQHLTATLQSDTQPVNPLQFKAAPPTPFSLTGIGHCDRLQSVSFENHRSAFLPTPDHTSAGYKIRVEKPVSWASSVSARTALPNSLLFRHNSVNSLAEVAKREIENERPTRAPSHFIFPPVDPALRSDGRRRVELPK